MLGLLYYWRLEKEKWVDHLILAIKELNKRNLNFNIFIFWKWSLEKEILEIKEKNIHYFWWQPLERIQQYLPNIDYCLMPSEFLETFWLSALNALSRWLPVIWYKKWWLEPFIFQECNLFLAKWKDTSERIISLVEKLAKKTNPEKIEDKEKFEKKIKELLPKYTEEAWIKNFERFAWEWNKKIIIVSDFINKAWGIETYIHDVKNLLERNWHEVILYGNTLPNWFLWNIKKKIWLLTAPINFWNSYKLKKILKKENPDIVWFNSLLRNLWHNVVKTAWKRKKNNNVKLWMMYHDFWYFYAYPSKLFFIEDCKTPLNRENFLQAWKWKSFIKKLAILFKYLRLQPLKRTLKKEIDLHLTPSDCVTKILSESYQISEKKCKTFSHFIQK